MKVQKKKSSIKLSKDDMILHVVVTCVMSVLLIVVLYPLIYVLSSSFSSGQAVTTGRVILWPVDFSLEGYKIAFSYKSLYTGYYNTIINTVSSTVLHLIMTIMAAYPLSRRNFQFKNWYTTYFTITMFVSGGLIPTYILYSNFGLIDTRAVLIIIGLFSVYHVIIMRTNFQGIPNELLESAKIDGITDLGYLFKIVIPLSKAVFSVITLYSAVGKWNSYFPALMYTRSKELRPLQLVLRLILQASSVDLTELNDAELIAALSGINDVLKFCMIVLSSVPVIVAYPFVQKFFTKGTMVGSIKG